MKLPKVPIAKNKRKVRVDYPFLTERSRVTINTNNNSHINEDSINSVAAIKERFKTKFNFSSLGSSIKFKT